MIRCPRTLYMSMDTLLKDLDTLKIDPKITFKVGYNQAIDDAKSEIINTLFDAEIVIISSLEQGNAD